MNNVDHATTSKDVDNLSKPKQLEKVQLFGRSGRVMNMSSTRMSNPNSELKRLVWVNKPSTTLVLKKFKKVSIIPEFIQLIRWLLQEKKMLVFIEHSVIMDTILTANPEFIEIQDKIKLFDVGTDDLTDKIDLVVCLGGDRIFLYNSLLFQKSVPPIIAFHMGSKGFLTPFKFTNFQQKINYVLEGKASVMLRSRLTCTIIRQIGSRKNSPQKLLVLNDVVIDRGLSPYSSNIDLFLDGKLITTVQGDGLIISTPTGSTAYAVSAGASIIHPSIAAIMITPICPHSLSFKPLIVPNHMELKITLNASTRSNAWISFDGRNQQELCKGDSLYVTTSKYPVPSVCADDQISDWFNSLSMCLHWNEPKRQRQDEEPTDEDQSDSTP